MRNSCTSNVCAGGDGRIGADACERDLDACLSEVGAVGHVDAELETTESIEVGCARSDLVSLGVERAVPHRDPVAVERELAVLGCREPADPTRHADGLAGLVDATVVEDVPATVVGPRLALPPFPPIGDQERGAIAGIGPQPDDAGGAEIELGQAFLVGGGDAAVAEQLDRNTAHRLAGEQICGPHDELVVAVDRIESERDALDPRNGRPVAPIVLVVLGELSSRFDPDDDL